MAFSPSPQHTTLSTTSAIPPSPIYIIHHMTTGSMNNIYKPKQLHDVTNHPLPHSLKSTYVSQALSLPRCSATMSDKLTTLMKHDTWELVTPPTDCKPMSCKWVFHVKRKANGSIDDFKARLVVKGFLQRPEIDYIETFIHMVKPTTIQVILTIVVIQG